MSLFRDKSLAISGKTLRRLHWIKEAELQRAGGSAEGKILTSDEIADRMLNEAIEQRYPQLLDAEKRVEAAEVELKKALLLEPAFLSSEPPTDDE